MAAYAIPSGEIIWGRYGLEEVFPYLKRVPEKDKMMEIDDER